MLIRVTVNMLRECSYLITEIMDVRKQGRVKSGEESEERVKKTLAPFKCAATAGWKKQHPL